MNLFADDPELYPFVDILSLVIFCFVIYKLILFLELRRIDLCYDNAFFLLIAVSHPFLQFAYLKVVLRNLFFLTQLL